MEKKQTAVEFYRTEFGALVSMKESKFQNENQIFEQAKQMEKEQIEDAWFSSRVEDMGDEFKVEQKSFDNYYNETYGGQDEH
jgi:hypothetical protein